MFNKNKSQLLYCLQKKKKFKQNQIRIFFKNMLITIFQNVHCTPTIIVVINPEVSTSL